jgi:hypothetical protein
MRESIGAADRGAVVTELTAGDAIVEHSQAVGWVPSESEEPHLATPYDEGVDRARGAVEGAVAGETTWASRVAAGLRCGLELLAADPALARTLLVDPLSTPSARLLHGHAVARLGEALRPPATDPGRWAMPAETARLLAEGLASHLSGRVLAGEAEQLVDSYDLLLVYLLTPPLPVSARSADEPRA